MDKMTAKVIASGKEACTAMNESAQYKERLRAA